MGVKICYLRIKESGAKESEEVKWVSGNNKPFLEFMKRFRNKSIDSFELGNILVPEASIENVLKNVTVEEIEKYKGRKYD